MPKISIIVPVYQVEKYLEKCVNSILGQTFTDFELILVDDGSTDRGPEMCDQYAKQDGRVKVIHKKNGGLSDARNAGIDVAQGEYLGFVDSDDYIAPDMYELLYRDITKENADLAISGIYDVYEGHEPKQIKHVYQVVNRQSAMKAILEAKIVSVHAVNKLYKRELFSECRYKVGIITEDAEIIFRLLELCNKIVINSKQCYWYVHRNGSISSKQFSKKDLQTIQVWKQNENILKDKYPTLEYNLHTRVCWANFIVLDKIMNSNKNIRKMANPDFKKIVSFLRFNRSFILRNRYFTASRKISTIFLLISPVLYRQLSKLEDRYVKSKN